MLRKIFKEIFFIDSVMIGSSIGESIILSILFTGMVSGIQQILLEMIGGLLILVGIIDGMMIFPEIFHKKK